MTPDPSHSRPSPRLSGAGVLSFLFLLFLIPSAARAALGGGGSDAARIVTARGNVFVRGMAQGDWGYPDSNLVLEEGDEVLVGSEGELTLEFPDGVFATLAQGSRLEIARLHPGLHLRLRYGTFHIVLLDDLHGYERARMEWPRGNIFLEERGCYRADVFRDGLARVATLRGEAIVNASGGRSIVAAGESVYVEPGGLPTSEAGYSAGDYDPYDRYVLDRYFSPQWPALPPFLAGYGAVGMRDLSRHGTWMYVPAWGSYAWRPRGIARSWRPFRDGRYAFTGFGWTWIPREPWGYATCHYGNWGYVPRYGWLWRPGRRFAPAWVRWGQAGNAIGWAVIGPNGRIVVPPAAIYGSPYVFMPSSDFKSGKPVRSVAPQGKVEDVALAGNTTPDLEPQPEAKSKAPRQKPGHVASADQEADQAEKLALKEAQKARKEAEHEARALRKSDRMREKEAARGADSPAEGTTAVGAPAVTPPAAISGTSAPAGSEPPGGGAGETPESGTLSPPPATEAPSEGTPESSRVGEPASATKETTPPPGPAEPSAEQPVTPSPPAPTSITPGLVPGTPSSGTSAATGGAGTAGAPGTSGKGGGAKHGGPKTKPQDTP